MTVPREQTAPISGRGLLLTCEGRDDEQFLIRMLDHLQIRDVVVKRYDGKPQLPRFLLGLRDSTEFETVHALGIFRDADASPRSAFQSVRDRLQQLELPRPRRAGELNAGVSRIDGIVRTVGVFIMPDNQSPGALEDLCLRAIDGDAGLVCAQTFLECVQSQANVVCRDQDKSKAQLNAWLASRRDPTLRLGQAIDAGVLTAEHIAFRPIHQFLTDLAAAASTPEPPPA
jgi:hypothetical protein